MDEDPEVLLRVNRVEKFTIGSVTITVIYFPVSGDWSVTLSKSSYRGAEAEPRITIEHYEDWRRVVDTVEILKNIILERVVIGEEY